VEGAMSGWPLTQEWKVTGVREGKVESSNGRSLQKFYVDFEGAEDTYWRRRAGDLPQIGKSYFGTIDENKYGLFFKTESKGRSGGGGGGGPMRERPASEIAGARHAHNLLVASGNLERLPADADPEKVERRIQILDFFAGKLDEQTAAISAEATAAGGSSGTSEPPATSKRDVEETNARERGERLDALLNQAGENQAAINLIVAHALGEMTSNEQEAAIERLEKDSTRAGAVKRLRERTEQFHDGEPLPETVPEDDIPF
jgi:hypothetical protein